MSTANVPGGNTLHNQPVETREPEKTPQRERWAFGREGWSPERERAVSMEFVTSGAIIEATGGFGALVLGILSLIGLIPGYLVPIAAIVLGGALLAEAGSVAVRYWKLPEEVSTGRWASLELAGGMIAEFLGGITGIVLGILALVGLMPALLTAVAVLVFGLAFLLGSGLTARLSHMESAGQPQERPWRSSRFTMRSAVGIQVLVGLAACVFGILGVLGISGPTLAAVGVLILGGSALVSGTALCTRNMTALYHR